MYSLLFYLTIPQTYHDISLSHLVLCLGINSTLFLTEDSSHLVLHLDSNRSLVVSFARQTNNRWEVSEHVF